MAITLDDVFEQASSELVFKRGQKYYQNGHVGKSTVTQLKDGTKVTARVEGRYDDYQVNIEVDERGNILFDCECPAYYEYDGACKHSVALMLKYYYEIQSAPKTEIQTHLWGGIEEDRYSKSLLAYYEDQIMREQELEVGAHPTLKIYPKLIEDYQNAFLLGMSVGDKKAYVVKDLYEFTDNMLKGNNVSYGKSLEFIHDISLFEESARALVTFIMDKTVEYIEVLKQVGMYRGFNKNDRKTIPLGAKAFDEFFDLVKGTEVEFVGSSSYKKVQCIEGDPVFTLSLIKEEPYYHLTTSLCAYRPILCSNNKYLLVEDKLYRLSEGFGKDVFPVLVYMHEGGRTKEHKQLYFTDNLIKRFMLTALSKVEKYLPVVIEEHIREEVTPEHASIKIYLDMDGEGSIIGDVKIGYKGFSFNPYKKPTEEERIKISQLVRDVQSEHRFNTVLRNYDFRSFQGKIYLKEEEDIYHFLRKGIGELIEVCEVNVTDKLKNMHVVKPSIGQVGIRIENNMLHVALRDVSMPMDEVEQVLNAYKTKSKYYRLKDGSFIDIEDAGVGEFANIIEGLGITGEDLQKGEALVPKYRALYLDQLLRQNTEIEINRDKYFKQIIRDVKNVEDADYEVPGEIKATLRSYQKRGYRWLKTMAHYGFGGILADDMGLGKTLQVITLIASELEDKLLKPSLVVCPTSLTLNWENEIQRFAPHLKALVVAGNIESRKALFDEIEGYHIVITSYELLKRDIEYYKEIAFRYCIADEAQYIKNANTLNAKALKLIQSEISFALTGTPIENSLAELWSLFDFSMPGYLFNYNQFKGKYEMPIVKNQDEIATMRLKKMVSPFILRRLKKDVLKELPDKTETVIYNNMEDAQKKLYLAHLAKAKEELDQEVDQKGMARSHIKILSLLTRLRQLCNHPALYLEDYVGGSGKLEQCMQIVTDSIEAGHRILLFSQFTSMLDILSNELTARNLQHFMLTGKTKVEERMHMVNVFNTTEVPVFLISLKAGGTGLNLTGADVVVHYDPWWNLSSQNQATDRAYRIGQKNNVQVFQLITKKSIEGKIKELQDRKIGLTESVLQEGENLITKMSEEELRGLFEI
ncbi:DEAD/DEAH box helicase [Cellulosilyticum sp. I15G10I2]|uniref:DEAD/DEAH box helicase n=1 Tax=Cellulosilyticum sp. I15G10I2 TaxID=1892843 RepID=UPI00085C4A5E|nr:SNF2 helicase associated domain-containing protein [Cellulosilyticum sp. I15G10I2]